MKLLRKGWRPALVVGLVVVAVVSLRGRLPGPGEVLAALEHVAWSWVLVAVVAALVSQVAVGEQMRALLGGFGVRLPHRRSVALAVAGSAISGSLPGGSAISATFTFRTFQRHSVPTGVAATVTVLSGIVSVSSLMLVFAGSWLLAGRLGLVHLLVIAGVVVAGALAARFLPRNVRAVPARTWAVALGVAVVYWGANLLCLVAAAMACGAGVGWGRLALVYLAGMVLRQVPLTPGGVGLVEAGMLNALIAAGSAAPVAAAVVLVYRLVSFWMLLPLGLAGYLALRKFRDLEGSREIEKDHLTT